jgi:hypothetical protein
MDTLWIRWAIFLFCLTYPFSDHLVLLSLSILLQFIGAFMKPRELLFLDNISIPCRYEREDLVYKLVLVQMGSQS